MNRRAFFQSTLAAGLAAAIGDTADAQTADSQAAGAATPSARKEGEPGLFSPLEIRGVTLRNRIAMSPMCQYSSDDGFANDWHLAHYGARATGGAGLLIAEATGVVSEGRITPHGLGVWKDEHIPELRRITDFIAAHGAVPGIQLAHSGVKGSRHRPIDPKRGQYIPVEEGGWIPAGPTAKRYRPDGAVPREMTVDEIHEAVGSIAKAALRSIAAGFRLVELHFAHGYLGHSFLTPLMNERRDEYGGSFENRTRFLMETVRAVRAVLPDEAPLFVRLSCTDWVEGGWTLEDSVKVAGLIKAEGVDLIDCSTGGATRDAKIPVGPGYQVPFAASIRKEAGIATGAVGLITEPAQADAIIADGKADLVIMGRELLREPNWPLRAWVDLKPDTPAPIAAEYAWALRETRR